jgi:hypothetical protein
MSCIKQASPLSIFSFQVLLSFLCSASPVHSSPATHNHSIKLSAPSRGTMAPSLLDVQPTAPHERSSGRTSVDRKIFPDGIKTSGQHPPIYELLRPYSDFPKEITGETVWKSEGYANNPERWVHVLNDQEVNELSLVADEFIADNTPLTGISKVSKTAQAMNLCFMFYRIISICQSYPRC